MPGWDHLGAFPYSDILALRSSRLFAFKLCTTNRPRPKFKLTHLHPSGTLEPSPREVRLATVPGVQSPRLVWHTRANWPGRDDRKASAVWLAIFWLGTIAGFGVDFPRFLHENPPASRVISIHAAVFSVWLLLLTAQIVLVLSDRVAWHRKLGWFAAGWAGLMAIFGPWAAMASQAGFLHTQFSDPPFLSVNIVDIGGFLVLLGCGIALRRNPAAHRRMMMLSTVAIADPGFSRFWSWVQPAEPTTVLAGFFYIFYGNVLMIALMTAWDWWRGRLMRSFAFGAAALLAAFYLAAWLYFSPPWRVLTTGWVEAWARHFG